MPIKSKNGDKQSRKNGPGTPPHDRYVLEMLPEREQKTAGGIYIPVSLERLGTDERGEADKQKLEVREFEVIEAGPGLWASDGKSRQPLQYRVGQVVLAHRPQEAYGFDFEGRRLYVLAETDIIVGL